MSTPVTAAGLAEGRMCALVLGGTHPERQRIGSRGLATTYAGLRRFGLRRRPARTGTRQRFASGSVSAMSQSR
jgi:hypothetical protein